MPWPGTVDAVSVSYVSFCNKEWTEQWGGVGDFAGDKVSGLASETCGILSGRPEDFPPPLIMIKESEETEERPDELWSSRTSVIWASNCELSIAATVSGKGNEAVDVGPGGPTCKLLCMIGG